MTRSTRTILVALAVLAVAAPAAGARPATESPAAGPQLTQGQLHRIDGPQPVALAPESPFVEVAPVEAPAGGTDVTPWIFLAVPVGLVLLVGGLRKATHRTVVPRRPHAHA